MINQTSATIAILIFVFVVDTFTTIALRSFCFLRSVPFFIIVFLTLLLSPDRCAGPRYFVFSCFASCLLASSR